MEFLYTIDPNAEEPIMLIDSHIGNDAEDGPGIMADRFCRELLFIDTLNKSRINVWINSPGGSVLDGMQIFNTILKSKTKVDTHNVGMCASIAYPIWLSGRDRYMMDNAVGMVHPVSGGDEESRKIFENCVNMMISSRSELTPEKIKGMMDATTWLSAQDCKDMGLCTIEGSGEFNKKRSKPDLSNVKSAFKSYKELVNSAIENLKPKKMLKVTNKLNLIEGSSEDAHVKAIEAIENKAKEAENKAVKMKADLDEAMDKVTKCEAELKTAKDALNAMTEEKNKAKKDKEEVEAKNEITNAVKLGKIENKAETIDLWTKNYLANPDGTKAMISAIALNKKGATIPKTDGGTEPDEKELTNVAGAAMAELRNKFEI